MRLGTLRCLASRAGGNESGNGVRGRPPIDGKVRGDVMTDESDVPVANVDAADGDWIKRGAWDIWRGDRLIDNVLDLREWIHNAQMSVDEFKQLVVYRSHLDDMPWLKEL